MNPSRLGPRRAEPPLASSKSRSYQAVSPVRGATATAFPAFDPARTADLTTARHPIAAGKADMPGMTRAHMADPHIMGKVLEGREVDYESLATDQLQKAAKNPDGRFRLVGIGYAQAAVHDAPRLLKEM